jgi:hypothetical protein
MKFPTVTGNNLEGRRFVLPADLEGDWNVLVLAFWQEHQNDVNTWLPHLRGIAASTPAVRCYELPVLWQMNPIRRYLLDNGMRLGIPDRHTRETTITVYLDKPRFRAALGLEDERQIALLLVNRAGDVAWSGRGRFRDDAAAQLSAAITSVVHTQASIDTL